MRQKARQFSELGAQVVLVGLGTVAETADFKTQFNVPFPMIADPRRQLYTAFELKRATTASLLSLGTAVKGISAMVRGHGIGIPKGDVHQLPGVFIIDTEGRIQFSHYAKGPADHPDPDALLAMLASEGAQSK